MNNTNPSKNYRRWLGGALLLAAVAALVWATLLFGGLSVITVADQARRLFAG